MDPIEERAQLPPAGRIDRFDETHPSLKMQPEARMSLPVLTLRTQSDAVREYRFQEVEIGAPMLTR
jgi:hypothetical protein